MKFGKLILLFATTLFSVAVNATSVNVVGLFSGKAIVTINGGKTQTLSVGQTKDGVKLLAADSASATFLIEGKRQILGMGQAISVGDAGASTANQPVSLYADPRGHFLGNMQVNGASLKFMVDTGATVVAMNSADAKYANVDYKKGELVRMSTANGLVDGYRIQLNSLKIGSITLNQVDTVVLEGGSPEVVLLGMSALNRMDMKRDNAIMTLTKKY